MTDDRSTTRSISFKSSELDLYEYVENLADEKYRGNFSAAIMDCIKAHEKAREVYGKWELIGEKPHWLS